MPIVNMNDMLNHAYRNGYAVGSFNVESLDFLKGILQAAEQACSPVILSLSEVNLKHSDIQLLMPAIEAAARRALVPVALQFNHCISLDSAIEAINSGFNGIMVDASCSSIQKNFTITSDIVNMAHGCGVTVEGKISFLPVVENKNPQEYFIENTYNSLGEISDFVKKTGVDLLEVAIKNLPHITPKKQKLDLQRLKQINETLNIPLATEESMVFSDNEYCQLIANGVAKIFFDTTLHDVIVKQSIDNIKEDLALHMGKFSVNHISVIADETERYMHLMKSSNRAVDVLTQCHQWTPVEHLIIYNVDVLDKKQIKSMIIEGRKVLSTIPGVREVFTGEAVLENATYRYTWLVRFCHPLVIDSYRIHPVHTAFADNQFRPIAGERISIDYETIVDDR